METADQTNNRPWLYKKGQSGNPSGRPKGAKSMKTWVREYFESLSDEERLEFLSSIPNPLDVWKMGEGNPATTTDVTSGGKALPIPIINVFTDNGNEENKGTE